MNKQAIITALLAFFAMVGQAQMKSGLDLCLRDEATGEWLIGLFDEYTIYDCEYWDYADIQKDKLVLRYGERRMDVQMKRKGQAVMSIFSDSQHPLEHTFVRLSNWPFMRSSKGRGQNSLSRESEG